MALPNLIEIEPLKGPVEARVTVPGSKSITNRTLILAALADGETTLRGALWSEDTEVMMECLRELGFLINVRQDPSECCNRTITVYGKGGNVPPGGSETQPVELFVANAGTAARFLAPLVCLGKGTYRISGTPRMHERPQAALFDALRQLGYRVDSENNRLPAVLHGAGPRPGDCVVEVSESSQFASALLLASSAGGWRVKVRGESEDEMPYVTMTSKLLEEFSLKPTHFQIEPDASSGSYFWAAGKLLSNDQRENAAAATPPLHLANASGGVVQVANWPMSGWQIDQHFPEYLASNRQRLFTQNSVSRRHDLGDSIMTAIVLAPFAEAPVQFTDLGKLRLQECERVKALKTELSRLGARVLEEGDALKISPSQLHGAEIETYQDHRMAMCFAVLGLKVPGIRIRDPGCVRKTFPDFFQKLACPPPQGLGALVVEPSSRRSLSIEELIAV